MLRRATMGILVGWYIPKVSRKTQRACLNTGLAIISSFPLYSFTNVTFFWTGTIKAL